MAGLTYQNKLMQNVACPVLTPAVEIVAVFKALADPLRLQVVEVLREQEMCVCDLCDRTQVAQSKLSFHLKILKEAGVILSRQEGRWMYYRLNLAQLVHLEQYLADFRRFSPMLPSRTCVPKPTA